MVVPSWLGRQALEGVGGSPIGLPWLMADKGSRLLRASRELDLDTCTTAQRTIAIERRLPSHQLPCFLPSRSMYPVLGGIRGPRQTQMEIGLLLVPHPSTKSVHKIRRKWHVPLGLPCNRVTPGTPMPQHAGFLNRRRLVELLPQMPRPNAEEETRNTSYRIASNNIQVICGE